MLERGTFNGNAAAIGGAVAWTGGRLNGGWTVGAGQTLNGQDGGFKYLSDAGPVLGNEGTIAWNTGDLL